jgi:predicted nucleic acid binding AN1-type Zn finger protein
LRKTLLRTTLSVLALGLFAAASAYALTIEISGTVVSATVDVAPRELPARGNAPVQVSSVTRIKTTDSAPPPQLSKLVFIFDKNGAVNTQGLPVCTLAKLDGTTSQKARERCAGAIVGEGVGRAEVNLPGAPATEISSPLTFFNGPPDGGKPTLIIHAYETLPKPQAVLVAVPIERIKHGRYGFRVEIEIPEIAGGFGAATLAKATIGKTWTRNGKTSSYASAHCVGGRLQVYGKITMADGSFFPGTLVSPCHVAG